MANDGARGGCRRDRDVTDIKDELGIGERNFEHVEHPRIRQVLSHWLECRDASGLPPIEAIDPAAFPSAAPNLWLIEMRDGDLRGRFHYRLAGQEILKAHGGELAGSTLEEVTDLASHERVIGYFSTCVDRPAIVHVIGRVYAEGERPARGERLLLPFHGTDGRVTRLLGITIHSWEDQGAGSRRVPPRQVRTFTPVDGSGGWCETWMEAAAR